MAGSSSSASTNVVDASEPKGNQGAAKLSLLKHEGLLFADEVSGGKVIVSNRITCERHTFVNEGEFGLVFDDVTGMACLFLMGCDDEDDDSVSTVLMEETFKMSVLQSEDGEPFVQVQGEASSIIVTIPFC